MEEGRIESALGTRMHLISHRSNVIDFTGLVEIHTVRT